MESETKKLVQAAAQAIYDKKGSNILALDISQFSNVTDYIIIAEGMVDRHVIAIAHGINKALQEAYGIRPNHIEGFHSGDWVLLDYTDFIIHLFMPGLRETYSLEKLWSQGTPVDLKIVTNSLVTA